MDYCIRKLLGLTEENFITDENWLEIVTENHETVHKINGTWTSTCTSCLYCSSENMIKHSPMEHKIRIPHLYGNKTILDLKVQRFICKDCRKTWVVDCPLVHKIGSVKMKERIKDARPMMDLMTKKIFTNPEITA